MVGGRDVVRVLNLSAFHDTDLVCSGDLAYLGDSWSKNVGSAVSSLNRDLLLAVYALFPVLLVLLCFLFFLFRIILEHVKTLTCMTLVSDFGVSLNSSTGPC